MKILFTGGGTGGHVVPIIAIAREIRGAIKSDQKLDLFYIGPKDEISENLFFIEKIKFKQILSGKIRRYLKPKALLQNIVDILIKIPIGIIQSFFYIFFLSPDVIISKGGYGSIPPTIAARILQVPIFLHESDVVPGLANKTIGKFAIEIFTSFLKTESFTPEKMIFVGNPIRKELLNIPEDHEIEKTLGFKKTKPIVLILGGSQGSQRINELVLTVAPNLLSKYEVIHQCGIKNFESTKKETDFLIPEELKANYHLYSFMSEEEIRTAFYASDLIVSRAGSTTIFEISAIGKPSILIPLPESAQDHQVKNAYAYSEKGAGVVIEEENLTPNLFSKKIETLINNEAESRNMSIRAKEFSKPRSAKIIAEYILEYLQGFLNK